jgi:hypothetical protein
MPKAHAFQAWVKAAYLSHNTFFIPSASPCLQAWVVDQLDFLAIVNNLISGKHFGFMADANTMKKSADRLFQQWNYRNSTTRTKKSAVSDLKVNLSIRLAPHGGSAPVSFAKTNVSCKTARALIKKDGTVEFIGDDSGKAKEAMERAFQIIFSKGKVKEHELYSALGEYAQVDVMLALFYLERSGKITSKRSIPLIGEKEYSARYTR